MRDDQFTALKALLERQHVLSLAVIVDGAPVIGLLPFALGPDRRSLVVHASQLARHAAGLMEGAAFDALIHEPEAEGGDPMQIARVTLRGRVHKPEPGSPGHAAAQRTYIDRFPHAEPITMLGDFSVSVLQIDGGRLVTGFASAANVTSDVLERMAME